MPPRSLCLHELKRVSERQPLNGVTTLTVGVVIWLLTLSWNLTRLSADEPKPDATAGAPTRAENPDIQQLESKPGQMEHFEKRIRPLLIENCYECHAGENADGGLRLDSRDAWQIGGDSGPAVIAGEPDASLLMEAVRYHNLNLQMPPDGKLADDDLSALEKWIAEGAFDPRDGAGGEKGAGKSSQAMSIAEGREFWSMQPLSNPSLPAEGLSDWGQSPIDAFVLAKLKSVGLKPAPPADRRTLIRRVTFDLIGLPPTPEQIDNFLADTSVNAWSNLVERLLQSPQYGERWGRHWLDVARYADSNGLDENLAYGNAWRYRDYVVNSFNADKPFNQFLVEQLAGDLVPYANEETRTATGFLALGAKVLAEPDREKLIMDTVDEQIDTVGKAFMGMTLGCARCHDHKFDPILQNDYYALAAIFKGTRTYADSNTGAIKHWFEHSFAKPAEKSRLKEVEAGIQSRNAAANQFKQQAMQAVREQAQDRAAAYLAAATLFTPADTPEKIQAIADRYGLHLRILHHCRLHLEHHPDEPLVKAWRDLIDQGEDPEGIESYFVDLFAEAKTAPQEASEHPTPESQEASPQIQSRHQRPLVVAAREALADQAGFLTVPPQPEYAFDAETLQKYYALMEEARVFESAAPDETAAMGVSEGSTHISLPVHIRGSHLNLGAPVEREFPEVMRYASARPVFPADQSGRLELAQWMASSQHPLTARVYVNRIWGWHFGHGLVRSTENFGKLGDRPSHPALLDWLARAFMRSGWKTKELHRLLVCSSTYQMASVHPDSVAASSLDPENRLLWKMPVQRLEAEQIRDAILAVSGRLDGQMYGKSVPLRNRQFVFNHTSVDHTRYESLRRAVYLPVIRNNLYTFFGQFDFPDPTMPTGNRNATVIAPQALLMMNDELIIDSAEALARRVTETSQHPSQWIEHAYQLTLGRMPNDSEMERAKRFLIDESDNVSSRWVLLCQSLLACNEFMYID